MSRRKSDNKESWPSWIPDWRDQPSVPYRAWPSHVNRHSNALPRILSVDDVSSATVELVLKHLSLSGNERLDYDTLSVRRVSVIGINTSADILCLALVELFPKARTRMDVFLPIMQFFRLLRLVLDSKSNRPRSQSDTDALRCCLRK